MASCCTSTAQCDGTNRFFTRWSKKYAKDYKKKGLAKEQRLLLEGVRAVPVRNATILDIGCGVGALHHALLKEGAARSVGVDAAEGMVEQAKLMAEQLGVQDRTEYHHADFLAIAASLEESDITLMDKVVCCDERLDELIDASSQKTRRVLGLTHPKNSFFIRVAFKMQIAFAKLFRWKFHPYWHDWARMQKEILQKRFTLKYESSTLVWTILVFQRCE
jgi:magnesium-protoporphyrin O-methyltransferase